jgi:hypothetical protein
MPKYEEQIGVKIPGQGHYMVSLAVGPFDTDEQVLSRISTRVGTIFNVTGQKFEVVSSQPFKLRKLVDKSSSDDEEEAQKARPPKAGPPKVEAPKTEPLPRHVTEPPPSEKRTALPAGPQVGERWKPKDPRRIASFVVVAVEDDYALTDDNRKIQLARFPRYERVSEAPSKAS